MKRYINKDFLTNTFFYENENGYTDKQITMKIQQASSRVDVITKMNIEKGVDSGLYKIVNDLIELDPAKVEADDLKEAQNSVSAIREAVATYAKFALDTQYDFITGSFSQSIGSQSDSYDIDFETSLERIEKHISQLLGQYNFEALIEIANFQVTTQAEPENIFNDAANPISGSNKYITMDQFFAYLNAWFKTEKGITIKLTNDSDQTTGQTLGFDVDENTILKTLLDQDVVVAVDDSANIKTTEKLRDLDASKYLIDYATAKSIVKKIDDIDFSKENSDGTKGELDPTDLVLLASSKTITDIKKDITDNKIFPSQIFDKQDDTDIRKITFSNGSTIEINGKGTRPIIRGEDNATNGSNLIYKDELDAEINAISQGYAKEFVMDITTPFNSGKNIALSNEVSTLFTSLDVANNPEKLNWFDLYYGSEVLGLKAGYWSLVDNGNITLNFDDDVIGTEKLTFKLKYAVKIADGATPKLINKKLTYNMDEIDAMNNGNWVQKMKNDANSNIFNELVAGNGNGLEFVLYGETSKYRRPNNGSVMQTIPKSNNRYEKQFYYKGDNPDDGSKAVYCKLGFELGISKASGLVHKTGDWSTIGNNTKLEVHWQEIENA